MFMFPRVTVTVTFTSTVALLLLAITQFRPTTAFSPLVQQQLQLQQRQSFTTQTPSSRIVAGAAPWSKPTASTRTCRHIIHRVSKKPSPSSSTGSSSQHYSSSVEGDFDPIRLSQNVQDIQAGSLRAKLYALYKFTRPHTIRGTILASVAGTVRALLDSNHAAVTALQDISSWRTLLPRALLGMLALLLGNAFIVGINQIYDDEIDKVNKPFLPVASGEMTKRVAWTTVAISGTLGPILVKSFFPPLLFKLYMLGWFLGCIYSVPPIRTKQNPILAGLTIATVRGFLLNFGVYYAVQDALLNLATTTTTAAAAAATTGQLLASTVLWSPKVAFMARFMTIFASCIAITKDLPDVDGDRAYSISTFSTRWGVAKIAKGATVLLFLNYIHAIVTGILTTTTTTTTSVAAAAAAAGVATTTTAAAFSRIPMIGGHLCLAMLLLVRYKQLDPDSTSSIKVFYKHVWDLFYMEYGLYTLI